MVDLPPGLVTMVFVKSAAAGNRLAIQAFPLR
jgi:hypothetical protein